MIRILHYLDSLDWKGEEQVIMNYYRHINTDEIQFDFVTRSQPCCRFQSEIENKGGKVYFLPSRERHPFKYIKAFRKVLKENKYSIVHINKSGASLAIDAMICKTCRVKSVIGHSHNTFCSGLWLHRICKLFVNWFVKYRFACSEEAGRWIFGKKKDVIVLNNAVDTSRFAFHTKHREHHREEFQLSDKFVVGFVGRLENQKNPLRLIDIFNQVASVREDAALLVVGDGSFKEAMQEKINAYGLQGKVVFTGARNDVPELLSVFDVFLLPSLYEGQPVSIMEAMANGLPIVASDVMEVPNFTSRVNILKLEEPDEKWAEVICNLPQYPRNNVDTLIRDGGYDISCEAEKLQAFYKKISDI